MAETLIVKSSAASFDAATGQVGPQVSHKILGEDIASAVTPLEMRTDGLLYRANAAAADSHAVLFGFSTRAGKAGQTMTVYGLGVVAKYSDELLVPGSTLYLGTLGTLSSTPSVGDSVGVAQAIDASNIRITRNTTIPGAPLIGVAAGGKVAFGEGALDGANPTPIATGLTTVTSFVAIIKKNAAPGVGTSVLTADIAGAAGNVNVYGWKPTSNADPTLIASAGVDGFYWIASGT